MGKRESTYAATMRADGKFPIAFRLAGMRPKDVAAMIWHALRECEENSEAFDHVDLNRTKLNRVLFGSDDIAKEIVEETREMSRYNLDSNIEGLTRLGRWKDVARAQMAGLQDPWYEQKKSRGPLREAILTLHRDFFKADEKTPADQRMKFLDDAGEMTSFDMRKVERFIDAGEAFFDDEFGDDLRYLRVDLDEQSIHFHAILARQIEEDETQRYALGKRLFKLTDHRCIGDRIVDGVRIRGYETAQNVVGDFFNRIEYRDMNIVRGENRAEKKREAWKEIQEMTQGRDFDVLLGEAEALPNGSKNAQAMFLLKKQMAEAIAKKGDASKVRKDDAAKLAVDHLVLLGVITPEEKSGASKRRARDALLSQHAETFGTPAEIIADPDAAAAKVLKEAGKQKVEADRRIREAQEIERRNKQEEVRREQKFAAKEAATKKAEAKRKADLDAKEAALIEKDRQFSLRERAIIEAVKSLKALGDQVRAAARHLGILDPIVRAGVKAAEKIQKMSEPRS